MTDKETIKRIEDEAEKYSDDWQPIQGRDPFYYGYQRGAKSERNKVLDEAIENVTKLGENVDPIFQVAFYSIINELKSLKL